MKASIAVAVASAALLCACAKTPLAAPAAPPPTATPAPAASIMPPPTVNYTCERGTKLAVKMLGATTEVTFGDPAITITLPVLGDEGTTYTNGRQTLFVKQGNVSWAIGRMAAEACKPD